MTFNFDHLQNDIWSAYRTIVLLRRPNQDFIVSGPNTLDYRGDIVDLVRFMNDSILDNRYLDEEGPEVITHRMYLEWFNNNIFRYVGFRYNRIRRVIRYRPLDPEEDIDLNDRRYDPIPRRYDPNDPDDVGDPGDEPDDPDYPDDPNAQFEPEPYTRRTGVKLKLLLRLLLYAVIAGATGVYIDGIIKAAKREESLKLKDPNKIDPPKKDPTKPVGPKNDNSKFSKINHNELFDSVGLGDVIDYYNLLVDQFNSSDIDPSIRKNIYKRITDTYNKFAKVIGVPELKELRDARKVYDDARNAFETAKENGMSVAGLIAIATQMQNAARELDFMTDKYMNIENGIFKGAFGVKSKEDADVTIDDHDANINFQVPELKSKVDAKAKSIKGALLSKGMQERIARKMNRQGDFSNELLAEQRRFNDFSMVFQHEYPVGIGLDNPLQAHNKQIDIIRYKNPAPNPKPFKVPSLNKCIEVSKQLKPVFKNVIMIDNEPDDIYYNPMDNRLYDPNIHTSNMNKEFHESKLYNPEYTLQQVYKNRKAKDTIRYDDWIRSGPYAYVNPKKHNPAYQYGTIQQKYDERLNQYPLTFDNSDLEKGKEIKKVNSKLKRNRTIPNTFSLK